MFFLQAGGFSQKVDERIVRKIHELVGEGVRQVKEMMRHIQIFVKNELFRDEQVPPLSNRRFHPLENDIRNHMYIAAVKLRFAKLDQENLALKVDQWKKDYPADKFYFRGYGSRIVKENVAEEKTTDDVDTDKNDEIKVCKFLNWFELYVFSCL